MTRKDYEAIAKVFNTYYTPGEESGLNPEEMWELLRSGIADVFQADNPRFDRNRFYRATEGSDK